MDWKKEIDRGTWNDGQLDGWIERQRERARHKKCEKRLIKREMSSVLSAGARTYQTTEHKHFLTRNM